MVEQTTEQTVLLACTPHYIHLRCWLYLFGSFLYVFRYLGFWWWFLLLFLVKTANWALAVATLLFQLLVNLLLILFLLLLCPFFCKSWLLFHWFFNFFTYWHDWWVNGYLGRNRYWSGLFFNNRLYLYNWLLDFNWRLCYGLLNNRLGDWHRCWRFRLLVRGWLLWPRSQPIFSVFYLNLSWRNPQSFFLSWLWLRRLGWLFRSLKFTLFLFHFFVIRRFLLLSSSFRFRWFWLVNFNRFFDIRNNRLLSEFCELLISDLVFFVLANYQLFKLHFR